MNVTKADKMSRRRASAIRGRRILLPRGNSKLCLGLPEILRAAQDATCGFLQSRKPVKKSNHKPINVQ